MRSLNEKSKTLLTVQSISNSGATNIKYSDNKYYKPTPIEAERLQTLPDNYTEGISNSQRYKCLGNGWTVDVIAHILSFIPETHLHTVVGLFDGISCGQIALERAGKIYNQYYASEIDEYAIWVTQKNFPHTIQLGDVTKIDWDALVKAGVLANDGWQEIVSFADRFKVDKDNPRVEVIIESAGKGG